MNFSSKHITVQWPVLTTITASHLLQLTVHEQYMLPWYTLVADTALNTNKHHEQFTTKHGATTFLSPEVRPDRWDFKAVKGEPVSGMSAPHPSASKPLWGLSAVVIKPNNFV